MPILSVILWLPILGLITVLLIPERHQKFYRLINLGILLLQAIGVWWLMRSFYAAPASANSFQITENCTWMHLPLGSLGKLSIQYLLGVDGLNIGLVVMAICVLIIAAIASWPVRKYTKAYFALFLLLNNLIFGSLLALDCLLFYIFFEASLIPIYFFIGLWGGKERTQAATQFFLYTLLGTILILVVMIGLALTYYDPVATGIQAGLIQPGESIHATLLTTLHQQIQNQQIAPAAVVHTLDLRLLKNPLNALPDAVFSLTHHQYLWGYPIRLIGFFLLLMGFLIKLAAVPLHSWLPKAHVAAPTPISIILSAILLKIGGYGLLRIGYSIFPDAVPSVGTGMGIMGIVGIIYGALNALAMQDLKRMIAYASIAHMGFFLLGLGALNEEGLQGALYQLISHGFITTLLFLTVGILEERTQDRNLAHYSGLATIMPKYATCTVIIWIAAMGLPGFSGFIAELLILLGAFHSSHLKVGLGLLGAIGIFLNATYWIWTIQRVFGGPFALRFPDQEPQLKDLSRREYVMLLPLLIIILALGIFPNFLLQLSQNTIIALLKLMAC